MHKQLTLKVSVIHVCRRQSRDGLPGAAVWPCSIPVFPLTQCPAWQMTEPELFFHVHMAFTLIISQNCLVSVSKFICAQFSFTGFLSGLSLILIEWQRSVVSEWMELWKEFDWRFWRKDLPEYSWHRKHIVHFCASAGWKNTSSTLSS